MFCLIDVYQCTANETLRWRRACKNSHVLNATLSTSTVNIIFNQQQISIQRVSKSATCAHQQPQLFIVCYCWGQLCEIYIRLQMSLTAKSTTSQSQLCLSLYWGGDMLKRLYSKLTFCPIYVAKKKLCIVKGWAKSMLNMWKCTFFFKLNMNMNEKQLFTNAFLFHSKVLFYWTFLHFP